MAQGFTYCWSDHLTAKVYVGVHLGNPNDGYICSSKTMLSAYKNRPNDFTREILFSGYYDECAKFEISLIKGLFKTNPETYYNRSVGKKILFDDEIKNKMKSKAVGRKLSNLTIEKISKAKQGKTSPRKGISLSQEIKEKISKSKKGMRVGYQHSQDAKEKMSLAKLGKKQKTPSEETRIKLSQATKAYWEKRKQLQVVN
jgi:NUMOD3 motif